MISCLSTYGTGAAFAMRQRIDERSACASSSGGQGHDPLELGRGGERVRRPVQLHRGEPRDRVEPAQHHDRRAERVVDRGERERARVVQRPGGDVHLVAELQAQLGEQGEDDLPVGGRAQGALRLPGGARRVEHLGADARRVRRRPAPRRAGRRRPGTTTSQPAGSVCAAPRWRRTRRTPAPSAAGPGPSRSAARTRRRR